MADRLTQLQDAVNQPVQYEFPHSRKQMMQLGADNDSMAEHFCNSIGCLQQTATPSPFPGFDKISKTPEQPPTEDFGLLFAQLISRSAKDIDFLIEHLPNEESSMELQMSALHRLESENQQAAKRLEDVVSRGEQLLEQIQSALSDIAQTQLQIQAMQNKEQIDGKDNSLETDK